ncbi:MAG: hypothetical protein PHX79_06595 [Sphaerochaetaceae bacterium]|nr:hypothetical protein [Sphaerochaetaceae bacterium]
MIERTKIIVREEKNPATFLGRSLKGWSCPHNDRQNVLLRDPISKQTYM